MLDFGYQLPDCIWDAPEVERSRDNTSDFASHGERRFVRGLLPIPLENGTEFHYGVWLEVDQATFLDVRNCWNDEERYLKLRFKARVANAAPPWRTNLLGLGVEAGVREVKSRPFVMAAEAAWLQKLMADGWTPDDYREAVASFT